MTPQAPREHGLGRLYAADERDRRFAMRVALTHPELPPRPRKRPYNLGPTLNQGLFPYCGGFSGRDKLASAPIMLHSDQGPSALDIYLGAQKNDEWPGEDYEGTSVRGVFKYLQQLGYLESYVWAQSIADIEAFVRNGYGTVVLGTNWYAAMFTPNAQGFVVPEGGIEGGHAYHLFWMVPESREVWCKNSWGASWGISLHARPGCFKMSYDTLERLLGEDGEAGAGLEIRVR